MYMAIDRKPENGCEIQSSCCGRSRILCRLLVKKAADTEVESDEEENELPRGTREALELMKPWLGTDRIGCGDSYFASVFTAQAFYEKGTRFIGVIKNSTRRYPMKPLSEEPREGRGHSLSMTSTFQNGSEVYDMMAVGWVDRNRRYFVSTVGGNIPGTEQVRLRWRARDGVSAQERKSVPMPCVVCDYYGCASMIDRHNRTRQADLGLERAFQVKEWSIRVNTTLLGMCVTDAYNLYRGSCGATQAVSCHDFFCALAE